MGAILPRRHADAEATVGQSQDSLPLIGAARTNRALTAGQSSDGDWILPLIKRAQERTIKQAAAIAVMGIAKTQYIENLQGVGHLSVRKLGMLGEDFWVALIDELRAHFGLDDDEQQLTRAFDGMRASLSVIERIARKGPR